MSAVGMAVGLTMACGIGMSIMLRRILALISALDFLKLVKRINLISLLLFLCYTFVIRGVKIMNENNSEVLDDLKVNNENNGTDIAKKILKTILSFIFSVLYFISLNVLVIIFILKMAFSNGLIEEIIKMANEVNKDYTSITDLAYVSPSEISEKKLISNEIPSEDELEKIAKKYDLDEMDFDEMEDYFEDTVINILKENNIPEDVFAYTDENEENIGLLSEIGASFIEYAYGVTDELNINEKAVEKLINNAINSYERDTGKKVDRSKVSNVANIFTEELETFVEDNSSNKLRDVINSIFNGKIYYFAISLTIICLLVLILLNLKDFQFLKTIGVPSLIIGITYLLIGKIGISSVDKLSNITSLSESMSLVGTILTIASLGLILAYYGLKYLKKKSGEVYA